MYDSIPIRTFAQFRNVIYAFRLPRILLSAMELDLFNKMGSRVWTIPRLAKHLDVSRRGLEILCRNLAGVGLVIPTPAGYRLAPFSRKFLQTSSPDFRGAYLKLLQRQWNEWSYLTEVVRAGRPQEIQEPETVEYRQSFTWAMHHRSMQPAREVAQQVSMKHARTLLDLGGGPGTYALEFLSRNPKLKATLMDRPAALEVARLLAQKSSSENRLSLIPGDFLKDPLSGTYDVVWYSNVLHIYSPAENFKIFKKITRRLNPNGRLLIQDTFLRDPRGLRPLEANLFAVSMLLYTAQGNTYSLQAVRQWLQRAGLAQTRVIQLKRGTGDWEGTLLDGRPSIAG